MDDELTPDERNALRQLHENRGACPPAEALIAYDETELLLRRSDPIHGHVQICSRCQLVLHHLQKPKPAWWKSRWFLPVLAPAAAVLLAAIILPSYLRSPGPPPEETVRGSDLQPVAPAGTVASFSAFQWQSPIRVPQYRVNLYRDGALIWSGTGTTKTLAAPPELRLEPGASYAWDVEALSEAGVVYMKSRRQTFRLRP